jgi:hypothetical protein
MSYGRFKQNHFLSHLPVRTVSHACSLNPTMDRGIALVRLFVKRMLCKIPFVKSERKAGVRLRVTFSAAPLSSLASWPACPGYPRRGIQRANWRSGPPSRCWHVVIRGAENVDGRDKPGHDAAKSRCGFPRFKTHRTKKAARGQPSKIRNVDRLTPPREPARRDGSRQSPNLRSR